MVDRASHGAVARWAMRGDALQREFAAALHELRLLTLGHIHLASLHEGRMDEAAGGHRVHG